MKRLIEFSTDNGDSILVEVEQDESEEGGPRRISRTGEVIEEAKHSFDEALDKIKPVASTIIAKLRSLPDKPDAVEVKFGIKMNAVAGAVIACAGVEANYEIVLKWNQDHGATKQQAV